MTAADDPLRDLAARYRALFVSSPLGILRYGSAGELLAANPTVVALLGHDSESDVLARGAADLWVDPGAHARIVSSVGRGERLHAEAGVMRRRDGSAVAVSLSAAVVCDEGTVHDEGTVRGVEIAITPQHHGMLVHELNNALASILGFSDLALSRLDAREPVRGYVEEIRRAAERTAELVRHGAPRCSRRASQVAEPTLGGPSTRAGPTVTLSDAGTVLVVEDEKSVRDLALEVLGDAGFAVLAAGSGAEALALVLAQQEGRSVGVLLTDVVLPDMTGPQLAARLGDACPATVIYTSGHLRETALGDATPGEFLPKPYRLDELVRRVRRAMERSRSAGSTPE